MGTDKRENGPCFTLSLVRLNASHTFYCLCLIGAMGMILVGVAGWTTAQDPQEETGDCTVSGPGFCECQEYKKSGAGVLCERFQAAFESVVFNGDVHTNLRCVLKMGGGSMPGCLDTTFTYQGVNRTLADPQFPNPYRCKLNKDTFNCFPVSESLHNNGSTQYYGLIVGGSVWAFVSLCVLCIALGLEAQRRSAKHTKLIDDIDEEENDPHPMFNTERQGCFLKDDNVAVVHNNEWVSGRVTGRNGTSYDIEVSGSTLPNVDKRKVRSAGFKLGGWVVASEKITIEGTDPNVQIEEGLLGVVTKLDSQNSIEVCIGGNVFVPSPGQVMPTPPVRRGHKVEVNTNASQEIWEEGTVEGVHGDGILLVTKQSGGTPKAFNWVRRPSGIVVETLPDPEMPEVPSAFIFVDPDHHLAPTVMSKEEVCLYGGVRAVAKDLAEYRSAPAGKVLVSAALLTSSHLATHHLVRSERKKLDRILHQPGALPSREQPPHSPSPMSRRPSLSPASQVPPISPRTEPY
eukprot:TRINITY_DN30522_c0_g1_i1.p1 TRINITY_DN30522_c0_g1~~TRINITY_DN30522_c0_g1_i1.p1  ORF type:complete len:516 (+),score=72.61 TRINITY_DN30522_c0_g1_i1:52-1599(+)